MAAMNNDNLAASQRRMRLKTLATRRRDELTLDATTLRELADLLLPSRRQELRQLPADVALTHGKAAVRAATTLEQLIEDMTQPTQDGDHGNGV